MPLGAYLPGMRQRRPRTVHINFATLCCKRKEPCRQRYIGFLIAVLLSGCSSTDTPQPIYTPPVPPTQAAVIKGLSQAISEEKIAAPIEISALRRVEFGGFGSYFVCMKQVNPTSERHFVYSVFYNNEDYKGVRQSVIMEHCEVEAFSRIEVSPSPSSSPSPSPSPSPQSSRRKRQS
jgi:hypothetical protein